MADLTAGLEKEAAAIRARLEPKRADIRADEEQLARIEAALDVLNGNVALASGAGRAKQANGRRSRGGIDEAAVVAFVQKNQPASARDIGENIGVTGNRLSNKLTAMVKAGLLTKTGERRGTRYSAA